MSYKIDFDRDAFEVDVIQKAAYRFIDRMSVEFQLDEKHVHCTLGLNSQEVDHDALIQDFHKEVLDQALRKQVASETESIRHLILAHAFSRTGLT
ncbi:His-Xaa-Ser system protein HxsD [Paraburkholderia xenovorans]|jgi:His-Xaa-Ser system protein HxsD